MTLPVAVRGLRGFVPITAAVLQLSTLSQPGSIITVALFRVRTFGPPAHQYLVQAHKAGCRPARCVITLCSAVNRHLSQSRTRMKKIQVVALALTSLLAAASLAAEAQRLDSPAASSAPLTARQSISTQPIWFTDFPKAQARAKAEGKHVLLFFHGSGWCPACVEMQRQVFDHLRVCPITPGGRWFSWTWTFLRNPIKARNCGGQTSRSRQDSI